MQGELKGKQDRGKRGKEEREEWDRREGREEKRSNEGDGVEERGWMIGFWNVAGLGNKDADF